MHPICECRPALTILTTRPFHVIAIGGVHVAIVTRALRVAGFTIRKSKDDDREKKRGHDPPKKVKELEVALRVNWLISSQKEKI